MITSPMGMRPDFLIMGINDPQSGGVWLLASDSLFEANVGVDAEYETHFSLWYEPKHLQIGQTISVDTKMTGYIWIWGETYADAMRNLQKQWTPKQPTRNEIDGRLELEQ